MFDISSVLPFINQNVQRKIREFQNPRMITALVSGLSDENNPLRQQVRGSFYNSTYRSFLYVSFPVSFAFLTVSNINLPKGKFNREPPYPLYPLPMHSY
jgi:hypothetical protein